ncbi:hypothetical protein Tco_0816736 [Tanacetum coccineum]
MLAARLYRCYARVLVYNDQLVHLQIWLPMKSVARKLKLSVDIYDLVMLACNYKHMGVQQHLLLQNQVKYQSPNTAGYVHTLAGIVATDDNVTEDQPRSAILGVSLFHTDNNEVEVVLSDNGSSQKVTPDADSTADLALDDPLPVVEKGKVSDGVEHVVHELSVHCDPPIENLNAEQK